MAPEHLHWIRSYNFAHPNMLGHCWTATLEMKAAFPYLRRVVGGAGNNLVKSMGHFWCEAPDGEVLDPVIHGQIGCLPDDDPRLAALVYEPGCVPPEDEPHLRIVFDKPSGLFQLAFNGVPEAP